MTLTFDDYVAIAKAIDNLACSNKKRTDVLVNLSKKDNILCFDLDVDATSMDDLYPSCDIYLSNVVLFLDDETEEPVKLDKELLSGLFMCAQVSMHQAI